jgi:hypothetical protein
MALPTRLTPRQAILYGALTVATLDGLDACVMSLVRGSNPARMFRGVAYGLLGPAALDGGLGISFLGLCIHVFVATMAVITYFVVSRKVPALRKHWFIYGPLYGLAVYLVMYRIVMPLSAIGRAGQFVWPRSLNDLAIHAFGVGLPSAFWASRAPVADERPLAASPSGRAATHA